MLDPKIKLRLYKTLLRPILEYPILPMCIASYSNKQVLQSFQNISLRQVVGGRRGGWNTTAAELHEQLGIEPINVRIHQLATKAWEKVRVLSPDLVERSENVQDERGRRDHLWWKRISPYVNSPEPLPRYT